MKCTGNGKMNIVKKGEIIMFEVLIYLILSHLIGDYVLQCDFIAKSKGDNFYHLIVHCGLYVIPFTFIFGVGVELLVLFMTHVVIDMLKAKCKKITYIQDQVFHYIIIVMLYLICF